MQPFCVVLVVIMRKSLCLRLCLSLILIFMDSIQTWEIQHSDSVRYQLDIIILMITETASPVYLRARGDSLN